jgi:phosphohistidine swiveling domain-containing protein
MITRLEAWTRPAIGELGGKATGLVRLLKTGLPVPEAWCVRAAVSLDAPSRDTLTDTELPRWWRAVTGEFPGSLWAVRSSAVAEDLDHASFAGVYDTILGVDTLDALIDAVQTCWQAVTQQRATAYRAKSGTDAAGGIAIVLQRMLQPRAAGVMLTTDPLRPFDDRIVIDAAYGLGEAVVSGATDPDHFVLNRTTGEELRRRIGDKEVEILWDNGLLTRDVDGQRRAAACLSEADLQQLHAAARVVDTGIGPRRDLEWAIEDDTVYLLQDRAITGLPSDSPTDVFSRRYGDEYLAEYCFPVAIDLCFRWIEDTRNEMDRLVDCRHPAVPSTRFHHGYAYISGNWVRRQSRALPAAARANTLAWFPPMIQEKILAEPFDIRQFWGMLRAPYADKGRGPITQNLAALQRHCAEIDRLIVPKLTQDYTALSAQALRADCDEVDHLGLEHFRVVRWGMSLYNPTLHAMLPKLLARWCGDEDGESFESIISGLPGTTTARINREVFSLGVIARANSALRRLLLGGADVDRARKEAPDPVFWQAFDDFLTTHGHRAATRDIAQPRWSETPDVILGMIAALVRPDVAQDPSTAERHSVARRCAAEAAALARAGRLRRPVLRKVIALTQQYTVYRENQRYHLDYLLAHLRNLMLEHGRRLTQCGVLTDASQVFHLRSGQLWALVDGAPAPDDLAAQLEQRLAHWLRHHDRLPAVYLYDDVEVDETAVDDESAGVEADGSIRGVGASRGVARGPAKVVRDLAGLADVEPGDILVASNIDPGWTSVFPIISGLITGTGGALSHGAILAREYGIPTVTSVKDVTTLLPTGTAVEIDGGKGTVVLTAPAEPTPA